MKTCTKCKVPKEKIEFYKDKNKRDGLKSWCKECHLKDSRRRESSYNELRKKYRLEHKEQYREKKRVYYSNHKFKVLESNKAWRQTENGRLLSYKRAAEARSLIWSLSEEEFFSFWRVSCHYCDSPISTIGLDRINSDIGYILSNVVPCCSDCNIIKMDMTYDQFIQKIIKIKNHLRL